MELMPDSVQLGVPVAVKVDSHTLLNTRQPAFLRLVGRRLRAPAQHELRGGEDTKDPRPSRGLHTELGRPRPVWRAWD